MLMQAIVHGGCMDTVRESALKVDSGRKMPCRTGESNLRQRRAGPMLYPLSYIPIVSKGAHIGLLYFRADFAIYLISRSIRFFHHLMPTSYLLPVMTTAKRLPCTGIV